MFLSEKLAFIELHKTGCTHIVKVLSQYLDGEQIGKHNAPRPEHFTGGRLFAGSVRNPWEWYLSLWSYGCGRKGAVHDAVTRPRGSLKGRGWRKTPLLAAHDLLNDLHRDPEVWAGCYEDVNDASKFRTWLGMMHDPGHWSDFGEGYGSSSINRFSGLLTYRYITLFCRNGRSSEAGRLKTYGALKSFEETDCYIDYFIRNETLESDLIELLRLCGVRLSRQQEQSVYSLDKSNVSSRKRKPAYYYDSETVELVGGREKLVVEKFGYLPPVL